MSNVRAKKRVRRIPNVGSIAPLATLASLAVVVVWLSSARAVQPSADPFARLAVYDGQWSVRAAHPWSGATAGAVDRLTSHCHRFTAFFACEQTINSVPTSLIVYSVGKSPEYFYTRTIAPSGLAGGRGDLSLAGTHWTYLDKPPVGLKGNWSRTENDVTDRDRIRFEEYESSDEGKTWRLTNSGEETREHG